MSVDAIKEWRIFLTWASFLIALAALVLMLYKHEGEA